MVVIPTYYRSDQGRIQVQVAGVALDNTSWDTMAGGDNAATTSPYMPGGMQPVIELGGVPVRSDLTITRIWSDTLINVYKQLDNGVGNLTVTASYTVLDANKNPVANSTITYTGVLKSVARPDYDSSTTTAAKLTLTVGLNGPIT